MEKLQRVNILYYCALFYSNAYVDYLQGKYNKWKWK